MSTRIARPATLARQQHAPPNARAIVKEIQMKVRSIEELVDASDGEVDQRGWDALRRVNSALRDAEQELRS